MLGRGVFIEKVKKIASILPDYMLHDPILVVGKHLWFLRESPAMWVICTRLVLAQQVLKMVKMRSQEADRTTNDACQFLVQNTWNDPKTKYQAKIMKSMLNSCSPEKLPSKAQTDTRRQVPERTSRPKSQYDLRNTNKTNNNWCQEITMCKLQHFPSTIRSSKRLSDDRRVTC